MKNNFNLILAGVGGQGVITLTKIIAEAAKIENKDVKTSELHGLSQKGGSVETHIRFGKKIFSPLVVKADLILSLEIVETLRKLHYSNKETSFLVNSHSLPYENSPSVKKIEEMMNKEISGKKYVIPASKICQEKLNKEVLSGIYLLGYAVYNRIIPLKEESVLKAIEELIPRKHLSLNKKAFKLALK